MARQRLRALRTPRRSRPGRGPQPRTAGRNWRHPAETELPSGWPPERDYSSRQPPLLRAVGLVGAAARVDRASQRAVRRVEPRRGAPGGRGAGGRGAPSGAGGLSPRPAPRSGPRVGRRSGPAGSSVRPSPPLALRLPLTRREDGCRTPGPQLLPLRGALLRPRTLLISPAGTTRGPSGGDEGPRDGTALSERRQHGERAGACGRGERPGPPLGAALPAAGPARLSRWPRRLELPCIPRPAPRCRLGSLRGVCVLASRRCWVRCRPSHSTSAVSSG